MNFDEIVAEYSTELSAAFVAVFIPATLYFLVRRERRKLSIRSPKLGILNLQGKVAEPWIAEDRAAIESFFSSVKEITEGVVKCDVLFIYADFDLAGEIIGSNKSAHDIIRHSGARIVVLASEPTGIGSRIFAKTCHRVRANIAITLERKGGEAFPAFYNRLFSMMAKGRSMAAAWSLIAPQVSGLEHRDLPSGFMTLGAGDVTFR